MAYYSPLRYPGGKNKLLKYIIQILESNNISNANYIEPYAGGASVALGLVLKGYATKVVINDIDPHIHAFWKTITENTEELLKKIYDTPVTPEEWLKQKNIYKDYLNYSSAEIGFATFFLNRTNHSGILKGGMIGGINQTGKWKIDARYNKKELIERIKKIGYHANRIIVSNKDASVLLSSLDLPKSSLIYLDPPYYVKGKDLYENHYKHNDHENIANIVRTLEYNWIISYDNVPEICTLYNGYKYVNHRLAYSAGSRKQATEVMFFSNDLKIPVESFY